MYGIWRMHELLWRLIVVVHLHNYNRNLYSNPRASKQAPKRPFKFNRHTIFSPARYRLGTTARLQIVVSCLKTHEMMLASSRITSNSPRYARILGGKARPKGWAMKTSTLLINSALRLGLSLKESLMKILMFAATRKGNHGESLTGQCAR